MNDPFSLAAARAAASHFAEFDEEEESEELGEAEEAEFELEEGAVVLEEEEESEAIAKIPTDIGCFLFHIIIGAFAVIYDGSTPVGASR